MRLRTILIGAAIVAVSFLGATVAMQFLSRPGSVDVGPGRGAAAKQVTRTSMIVDPYRHRALGNPGCAGGAAPRNLTGKRDNPAPRALQRRYRLDHGARPARRDGRPEGLAISTLLTGTLHVTGQIAAQVGNIGGALGNILNQNLGQGLQI